MSWLKGKRTYLVGIAMIVINMLVASGHMSQATADWITKLLAGLGFMALRAAVRS